LFRAVFLSTRLTPRTEGERRSQNNQFSHSFSVLDGIVSPSLSVGLARRIVADRCGDRKNVLANGVTHVAR
jgi:hypothetical protein